MRWWSSGEHSCLPEGLVRSCPNRGWRAESQPDRPSPSQCSVSRLRGGGARLPAPPTERPPLFLSEPSRSDLRHHTNSKMKLLFQDGTGWAFSGHFWNPEETSSFWLTVCLSVKFQSRGWRSSWRAQEALLLAPPNPSDKDTASESIQSKLPGLL